MFWNSNEIYEGISIAKYNDICSTLELNKIKYKHKVVTFSKTKLDIGEFPATNHLYAIERINKYYIYVNKNDFDRAISVIHKIDWIEED